MDADPRGAIIRPVNNGFEGLNQNLQNLGRGTEEIEEESKCILYPSDLNNTGFDLIEYISSSTEAANFDNTVEQVEPMSRIERFLTAAPSPTHEVDELDLDSAYVETQLNEDTRNLEQLEELERFFTDVGHDVEKFKECYIAFFQLRDLSENTEQILYCQRVGSHLQRIVKNVETDKKDELIQWCLQVEPMPTIEQFLSKIDLKEQRLNEKRSNVQMFSNETLKVFYTAFFQLAPQAKSFEEKRFCRKVWSRLQHIVENMETGRRNELTEWYTQQNFQ